MKNRSKSIFNLFTLFALLASLLAATPATPVYAANFFPATVADLIANITTANVNGADDVIDLSGGTFTLTVVNNGSFPNFNGLPAILADGGKSLTITNGTISRVVAPPYFRIIEVASGANLTINNLTISNGSTNLSLGGGIYNSGTLTVTNSNIQNNNSSDAGGAGIYNGGTLNVLNSTFSGNHMTSGSYGGGGINNNGTLNVTNSTFSANIAASGGAISNGGNLTVINSTFSDNIGFGSIESNNGALTITNSTISGASGIVSTYSTATANLYNTIVNTTGTDCTISSGTLTANTFNIDSDGTCDNATTSAAINLGSLADNGGPTQTMALLTTPISPAIDAGDNTVCDNNPGPNNLDQRGVTRPQGTNCDIGAFEVNSQNAPDFVVNVSEDSDDGSCDALATGITDCTLREAINAANVISGADTIIFDAGINGLPITLGSQLPEVTTAITINGNGSANTIIQANASPNTATYRVFKVDSAGSLTLNDVTIANGYSSDGGGGILNDGVLTITNSSLSGNSASNISGPGIYAVGGAVENNGTLTIQNSAISGNSATSNLSPSAYGGAIFNLGTVTIRNSTFSGNSATSLSGSGAIGGAIFNIGSDSLTIVNSTFFDNHAVDGTGGGNGGAIANSSTLTIQNSTFSGNTASTTGGGILNNSTLNLENTILANNTTNTGNNDCYNSGGDTIATNINNLIENNAASGNMCGTPSFTADPMLGPLANNGGSTQTFALLAGSPAIDTGDNTICDDNPGPNNLDQRGVTRPQDGDGNGTAICDIGAFEYKFSVAPPGSPIFSDVPSNYWAYSFIERLYNAGITGGCGTSPLIYCPDATVTRAQMAIFILRGIHGSAYTPPAATGAVFADVPLGTFADAWIEQLALEGVTGGCGGGNYCPDATITRAQMAIFLLRGEHGSGYTPPAATGAIFGDVPLGSFADAWIEQLALEGITSGCGGGDYCPDSPVTRAEMAVFLVRAFNLP